MYRKQEFNDINDLVTTINNEKGKFYYRGQRDSKWKLMSSLYRSNRIQEDDLETRNFISWLKHNKFLNYNQLENKWGDNVYYAIAQHYGYKTDLIDFTTDIEIAAYFASDNSVVSTDKIATKGAIWCVSEFEISCLKIYVKEFIMPYIKEKEIIDLFEKNQYNPFFEVCVPGLSRLNNQKGLFLWDYHQIFTTNYFEDPDYTFYQKDFKYTTNRITDVYIYPKPNSVEREFERYGYNKISNDFFNGNFIDILRKRPNTLYIKMPIINDHYIIDHLETQQWNMKKWENVNIKFYPNKEVYKTCYAEFMNNISSSFVAKNVYNEEILEMEFADKQGVASRCSIPMSLLQVMDKEYKKKQLDILSEYLNMEKSSVQSYFMSYLLHTVTIPQKLFDYEDLINIFVKCLLPSQFIFRTKDARIYTPAYLCTIGLV